MVLGGQPCEADQDFDHYFAGTYNAVTGLIRPNYAWQQTQNRTTSNTVDLSGKFQTGGASGMSCWWAWRSARSCVGPRSMARGSFTYDLFNPNYRRTGWSRQLRCSDAEQL